ncbi:unnamed protein product [Owenia fusiformis]|uniref:Uncharacterized protein n=1 Tax=Owenia fusiformis TaxID=6347 RepID=A0A8J1TC51_OWEFU|nr:unnamed protein product [Owenia fusiformis]
MPSVPATPTMAYLNVTTGFPMNANTTNITGQFIPRFVSQSDAEGRLERQLAISLTLCLLAVCANILSIAAVLHIPGRWNYNNLLIINLSVADAFGAISHLLDVVSRCFIMWYSQRVPTEAIMYIIMSGIVFFVFFYFASALTLLVAAIHRYIAICSPLSYNDLCTKNKTLIALVCIWCVSGLFALPGYCATAYAYSGKDDSCYIWNYVWPPPIVAIVFSMVILYCMVIVRLRRRAAILRSEHQVEQNYQWFLSTVIMASILVISFIPYVLTKVLRIHFSRQMDIVYSEFLYFFPFFHFIIDPLVYGLRTKDMNEGYQQLSSRVLRWRSSRHSTNNHSNTPSSVSRSTQSTPFPCYNYEQSTTIVRKPTHDDVTMETDV